MKTLKKILLIPMFIFCGYYSAAATDYPFSITTTNLSANSEMNFYMSASGTFYVDCGDDGTLSGAGVSGTTITRNDTNENMYTCTYSTGGIKTIRFGGTATGYNVDSRMPAIRFFAGGINYTSNGIFSTGTEIYIASISGSLGTIFPTLDDSITSQQPSFYRVFYGLTNVGGEIPSNLFSGVYGKMRDMMFYTSFASSTFTGNIPSGLFSQMTELNGWAFGYAFARCQNLTGTIPDDLFQNTYIGTQDADYAFYQTFRLCSNLSGYIPPTLFARLIADNSPYDNAMMSMTFYETELLTSCPNGTTQYTTGYEQYWGGHVSCTPNTLNVNWYNGNTQLSVSAGSQSCVYGGTLTVPTVSATKPGYTFNGWKVKH